MKGADGKPVKKGERMAMTEENFYKRIEMGEECIDDLRKEISGLKSRVNDLKNISEDRLDMLDKIKTDLYIRRDENDVIGLSNWLWCDLKEALG